MGIQKNVCLLFIIFTVAFANEVDDFDEASVEVVDEPSNIDIPYSSPTPFDSSKVYIAEHFDDKDKFDKNWVKSAAKKEGISEDIAKYDGLWAIEAPERDGLIGDKGLILKSKAKHSAIAAKLSRPFVFNTKPLVVQYEVLFQDGQECGGAYLKLLTDGPHTSSLANFQDKTPYTIMFGPDKCGNDHKLHFIFRHVNPKNGTIEEKHLKPDNTYDVIIDNKLVNSGSLLEDFTPPVNPPAEVDDPSDKKPADWDERERIPDPEAVKPDDWDEDAPAQIIDENAVMPDGWLEDEPKHIPDPDAVRPDDWDTEMDGEWEPPLIDNPACTDAVGCGKWEPPLINNPKYKGKWMPPLIENPNYKGKWRPKRIPNPDYFEDKYPFKMQSISAVGFELWSMSNNILFDNIIITEDITVAEDWAAETFNKKRLKIHKESESIIEKIANLTNEYPALWGFYILVLVLFVVGILYLCCRPSSSASHKETEEEPVETDKKKTDEVTEDDQEPILTNIDQSEVANDEDKEKYSDQDDDDDEEGEVEVESEEKPSSEPSLPKSGEGEQPVRKRKPRKE
ncbi:Calreticulin family [Popillia japonica]|uniref:Calreticulin family n=1 Tax=Popillia japonica TaxID=7064 RepID=A0AAW1LAI4_POPJA